MRKLGIIVYGETGAGKTTIAHEIKRALSKFDIEVSIRDTEESLEGSFTGPRLDRKLEALALDNTKILLEVKQLNREEL